MDTIHSGYSPRAELWQCLAQALLPPRGEVLSRALREDLADDLEYLATTLGMYLSDAIMEARAAGSRARPSSICPDFVDFTSDRITGPSSSPRSMTTASHPW
ncbi:MAG: hypothetical protein ACYC2E_03975 [Sulfuricella sp.]